MSVTNPTIDRLFDGGPPLKIERLFHLITRSHPGMARRSLIVALISWGPLLLLTAVQEFLHRDGSLWSFMLDFGAYGRFLIAAPIFIFAEGWCLPKLGRIARHFLDFGIVRSKDRERFDEAVRTTRTLLDSSFAEILTVLLAFAVTAALRLSVYLPNLPRWTVQAENHGLALSAAGLWHLWVSLPLVFILFLGWIWRQFLWSRFMWRIARFDLNLVAAHPDRAGGLKFLGSALSAYGPVALGLGAIVAGGVANHIREGASLYEFRFFVLGLVLFVLVFFVGPFLIFAPMLHSLRSRGSVEYGMLSCAVGHEFEAKWMNNETESGKSEALTATDFSATTDLYSIALNVYRMRYLPLSSKAIGELIVFTLIPFVPVVLSSVPIDTLLHELKGILL